MDPAIAEFVVHIYRVLEDNLERYRRLLEQRDAGASADEVRAEALEGARANAFISRMTFDGFQVRFDPDSVDQKLLPFQVFNALPRLAYALVGLAEEEPEPAQLLTLAELDGLLVQFELGDWIANCRAGSFSSPAAES
jgi:hypothetical protein